MKKRGRGYELNELNEKTPALKGVSGSINFKIATVCLCVLLFIVNEW